MTALFSLAGVLLMLWGLSLWLRDSSIIDIFWGPAFVLVTWESAVFTTEAIIVAALVSLWGLRLGLYLFWRNRGRGEDKRYVAMRSRHGESWWWKSAFIVFAPWLGSSRVSTTMPSASLSQEIMLSLTVFQIPSGVRRAR